MKPMGYDDEDLEKVLKDKMNDAQAYLDGTDTQPDMFEQDPTKLVIPEDRYGIACIGCGIEMHLQMIPQRDSEGIMVGWVFSCESCRPKIIGRHIWWGSQEDGQDLDELTRHVSMVYEHVTGGAISNPWTDSQQVIAEHEDYLTKTSQEMGPSPQWNQMLEAAEGLYATVAKYDIHDEIVETALTNFMDAWDEMLD